MVNYKTIFFTVLLVFQYTGASPIDLQNEVSPAGIFSRAVKEVLCLAPKAGRAKKGKHAVWPNTASSKAPPKKKIGRSVPGLDPVGLDVNTEAIDFSDAESKIPQLQRRIPFGANLTAVPNTPAGNLARISQILSDPQTTALFSQAGGYSNSHSFPTTADQQLGTTTGGLGGCTILIAHNRENIYLSHHWEYPGFNKIEPEHPTIMFVQEVMGFLTGQPNNNGEGLPLIAPGVATAAQPMVGATGHIITPGASGGFKAPNYRGKIASIGNLITENLEGTSTPFPYKRPNESQQLVRVTVEFCAADRHLRVMISDYRSGTDGGTRVVDSYIL
ncbi:hypothetical protein BJ878DRAFT_495290 [Calycina marina]|uniref:Uncharacterized protein n=1 Tax=Calycina marina TaxID=1763456 RepID=A0A9P7Z7N2_9HELO|nr:hypothetical protein BJ878DRAFT_495290 [Calycina marina]